MRELILAYQMPEPLLVLLRQAAEGGGFSLTAVTEHDQPVGAAAGVLPRAIGRPGSLPPAAPMLVLCGMTEERLDQFLDTLRFAGLRIPFKAVLTETNRHWLPGELFAHLAAERAEIQKRMEEERNRKG